MNNNLNDDFQLPKYEEPPEWIPIKNVIILL
jgi:hypothetical protein